MSTHDDTKLARLAVQRGYCTPEDVAQALVEQREFEKRGQSLGLGQVLMKSKRLTATELAQILSASASGATLDASDRTSIREAPAPPVANDLGPGDAIGNYVVEAVLGRGAMGIVYRARHQFLRREAAIKVLAGSLAERGSVTKRFLREGQLVSRLSHPNVVPIYEWGRDEATGRSWYAMEYVEGSSLQDVLAGRPPSRRRRVEWMATIARAIDYAHGQGVIHRDLKPANILVDAAGTIRIADFGLARSTDEPDDVLTRSGEPIGTPFYMSPEQCRGDRRAIDPRSDVYALGAILYILLTGRHHHQARTYAELCHKILNEDPPPLRPGDPTIPRELEAICLKALARDPSDRYSTAAAVAEDLERFLEGRGLARSTRTGLARAQRRRLLVRARLPLALAAALGAGAVLSAGLLQPDPVKDDPAAASDAAPAADAPPAEVARPGWAIETSPPGIRVVLEAFEPRGGRLVGPRIDAGSTPIQALRLEPGWYQVRLISPTGPERTFPVRIEDPDRPPSPLRIELDEIPEDLLFVPAGPFVAGEDRSTTIEVGAFLVERTEVAMSDYVRFVEGIPSRYRRTYLAPVFNARDEALLALVEGGGSTWLQAIGRSRLPATRVSHDGAVFYALSLGRRLPTRHEWEKAARGIDGRDYPWGDAFEAERAHLATSGLREPLPVGSRPGDASPYGGLDFGGNAAEWTSTSVGSPAFAIRGGSFQKGASDARTWSERSGHPMMIGASLGFRTCRSWLGRLDEGGLLAAMRDPEPGVRLEAARKAGEGPGSAAIESALVDVALDDVDDGVRRAAVASLARWPGRTYLDRILREAAGARGNRVHALFAAAMLAPPERLGEVAAFLREPDEETGLHLVRALLERWDRAVLPACRTILQDGSLSPSGRRLAALVLADFGEADGRDFLRALLAHPSAELRLSAARNLWFVGDAESLPHLLASFFGGEYRTDGSIEWYLGPYLQDGSGLPVLRRGLDHPVPGVRAVCAWALGQVRDRESAARLAELAANDPEPDVQRAAREAAARMP